MVAQYLDARRALWFHAFNEGKRPAWIGAYLKKIGLRKGVPDLLIFEQWQDFNPATGRFNSLKTGHGIAIEMKRVGGAKPSAEQVAWLGRLTRRGWITAVCFGAQPAIDLLQRYLVAPNDGW